MALQNAVIAYAKQELPELLKELSEHTHLAYRGCTIRRPKTRWGSCSSQHNIMLHAGLVLMSHEIARYVAIHELAHTKHLTIVLHFGQKLKNTIHIFKNTADNLNQIHYLHGGMFSLTKGAF